MNKNLFSPEKLGELMNRLSLRQKITIVGSFVVFFVIVIVFVNLISSIDYMTLYTGLAPEDSASVVEQLKQMHVPYRVSGAGSTIEVPSDKINDVRLQLASKGLPQSGRIGFEIFDKNSFGITDFIQKVNFRRALEGELARTIGHMKEVQTARVHLVIPEEKLFKEDQEKAKASVVLSLKGEGKLSPEQVQGITYLVASAVPGLTPQHVTVLDDKGNIFTEASNGTSQVLLSDSRQKYRRTLEQECEKKILAILTPVVGKGKVRTHVSIQLNFNKVEQTSEIFDPNKSVMVQDSKSQEVVPGSSVAMGVVGTKSVTGQVASGAKKTSGSQPATNIQAQSSTKTLRTQESSSWEVSKTVRKEVIPGGEIKKITVAVVVDDKSVSTKDKSGKITEKTVKWSQSELDHLKSLVTASIGIDSSRGDIVTIENIPFQTKKVTVSHNKQSFLDSYQDLVPTVLKYLGIFLLFAFVYFLIVNPLKKRLVRTLDVTVAQPGMIGVGASKVGKPPELPQSTIRNISRESSVDGEQEPDIVLELKKKENTKALQIQQMMQKEAKENSEKLSNILRAWLVEENNR